MAKKAATGVDLSKLEASVCKESFEQFSRRFWCEIPGAGTDPVWSWHMTVLCEELQTVAERIFKGKPKEYDCVFNICPGSSKPIWDKSHVMMGDGTWKRLRDIVVGDKVIGSSGKPCKVANVYEQGDLQCIDIMTSSGIRLVAAPDHPVMTSRGWVEIGRLVPGDVVALMHHPEIVGTTTRNIDEFRLAGYFIGDGSVTGGNCSLTNMDPDYLEQFKECAKNLGFDCYIVKRSNGIVCISLKRGEQDKVSRRGQFKGQGRGVFYPRGGPRQWLRDVGIAGKNSYTKCVPCFVWLGTDEQVAAFLAAYFQCDGCVSYRHGPKRNLVISMSTVSRRLAYGVQRLLLRLGVAMRIRKRVVKNGFAYNRGLKNYVYYVVETSNQDAASRFLDKIPLIGYKKAKLEGFRPEMRSFDQPYWPDKVVRVKKIGKKPCRCLTVEGDASFVTNGIVVHNSSITSILFPAWCWTRMPTMRLITASHTDDLALDLAAKSQAVILSDRYRSLFPGIDLDKEATGYFTNTKGGDRKTCTVGGKSPTGFHAHIIIIDDPLDPKKAISEAEIRTAKYFYDAVIPGRKVDKNVSVEFTVMQRLAEEDPTAHVLKRAKRDGTTPIRHICLPAELCKGDDGAFTLSNVSPPELAERYEDGLMDPKRLSRSVLNREKATMGIYWFSSQFLQQPVPMGGGMFRPEFFNNRCPAAPYHAIRVRYFDRASTSDGGCYTAGVLMAKAENGDFYVENVVHGQWEPDQRNEVMRATALKDRARYGPNEEPYIYVEAEGGSSGRDAWKSVARALAGFAVYEDRVSGKKDRRAEPWAAQLSAKNVWLVDDGTWDLQNYIDEHVRFKPADDMKRGRLKDQVDASSGAFNLLVGQLTGSFRVMGGRSSKDKGKLITCTLDELENLQMEHTSLLIVLKDPGEESREYNLLKELGTLVLEIPDLRPEDYQDKWSEPIESYGKLPVDLVMNPNHGKTLWAFLTKRRDPVPEVFVFCDTTDGKRAYSVMLAVCDILRLQRTACYRVSSPESKCDGDAPNRHIYETVKVTRGLIAV